MVLDMGQKSKMELGRVKVRKQWSQVSPIVLTVCSPTCYSIVLHLIDRLASRTHVTSELNAMTSRICK